MLFIYSIVRDNASNASGSLGTMTPGTNLGECKSSKISTFGLLFRASRVPMLSELCAPDLAIILLVGIGAEEEARAELDSKFDSNCVCQLYYTPLEYACTTRFQLWPTILNV